LSPPQNSSQPDTNPGLLSPKVALTSRPIINKLKSIVTKIRPSLSNIVIPEVKTVTSSSQLETSQRRATFLQQVPTILKKKNILLEPETFNTFMKHDKRKVAQAVTARIKTNHDVLEKNQETKNKSKKKVTSSYRGFNPRGKMYVNELWSQKYYTNIITSSLLKEQDDELKRLTYKTTQEKLNEINNMYIQTRVGKETSSNKLFIKHQNEIKISEDDLTLQMDNDYDFPAMKPKRSARAKLSLKPLNRSNTSAINHRSSYFVMSPPAQKQNETYDFNVGTPSHSKDREMHQRAESEESKAATFSSKIYPPSLEQRFVKSGTYKILEHQHSGTPRNGGNRICTEESKFTGGSPVNNLIKERYKNNLRTRRQFGDLEVETSNSGRETELGSQSVKNSTGKRFMSPMSNTMYRQMFNKYKLSDPLYISNNTPDSVWSLNRSKDETPTMRGMPIHGGRIEKIVTKNNETLDRLVEDCNEFQGDKKLKRMLATATCDFGGEKVINRAREKKEKIDSIKKESFIKFYTHIYNQTRKNNHTIYL